MTWPCHACGEPGVRNLGVDGYCGRHLAELYASFDPAVFTAGGVGLPDGIKRPEYGEGFEDLRCCRCGASWAGVCGAACGWCQRSHEIMVAHQAQLLLGAPDVDPADDTYEQRMSAWADRLVNGVRAEVITERQADMAWRRTVNRSAA